jgi:hypothetical protein
MSESLYEGRIRQLTRTLERERRKQADEEGKAARSESDVAGLLRDAERTSSQSTRDYKLRRAESKRKEANKAREAAAKASRAVSDAQAKLHEIQRKLTEARATRERRDRERRDREQRRTERERARAEAEREREMRSLSSRASDLEHQLHDAQRKLAPPEITVLFLASSPENLEPLRIDKEAREIQQRLRSTDYRDSIRFETRMARQLADLIQDL